MAGSEIVFPISLSYVDHWEDNGWPILRELATNAMDADPGFRIFMGTEANSLPNPVYNTVGTLFIYSRGSPLAIRHLLFGVSEKANSNPVGQFGEGLKLALLALTRDGLTAHLYTGGKHLWNEPAELHGEQVFKIVWEDWDMDPEDRLTIEVPDWPFKTFEERFVRPGDPRILFTDPFGRHILEEPVSPGIYVKGVWVQAARGHGRAYTFGYSLQDVQMNRDRGVVDSWNVNAEVGKLWASVTNEALLDRFWQAVKDQMAEKGCSMHGSQIANKKGMKQAFQKAFGNNAVLETDSGMSREAAYRGAKVITAAEVGGYGLKGVVEELVGTDAQHVAEMEGGDRMYLPDKKLSAAALKTLKLLRRMAKRIGARGNVYAYILPDDVGGERYKDDIRISLALLGDEERALATWLHEEGHRQHNTPDDTAAHVTAVAKVAAQVIASYACRR